MALEKEEKKESERESENERERGGERERERERARENSGKRRTIIQLELIDWEEGVKKRERKSKIDQEATL